MKKIFALAFAAALVASCSPKQGDVLITEDGVGDLKFGTAEPLLNGYTAAFKSEYIEMDDFTEETWVFSDSKGETAVVYYPDYRIDVFSPDFRTKEGLRPGDTLAKAIEIYGDFDIYAPFEPGFYFEFDPDVMAFELKATDMKGGEEAYNRWYLGALKHELTADDFEPDARIVKIMIRNKLQ